MQLKYEKLYNYCIKKNIEPSLVLIIFYRPMLDVYCIIRFTKSERFFFKIICWLYDIYQTMVFALQLEYFCWELNGFMNACFKYMNYT